jgi:hypothetical protein
MIVYVCILYGTFILYIYIYEPMMTDGLGPTAVGAVTAVAATRHGHSDSHAGTTVTAAASHIYIW